MIEDEKKLAAAVKYLFKEKSISCDTVYDGTSGYETAEENDYDVIILDVMLPGMDGFSILSALRKDGVTTPILMLTAKDAVPDKIKGLNLGADDYLTKPFDGEELIARVNALARRSGATVTNELTFGDLVLKTDSGELCAGGESVKLNFKEKELLKTLFLSPNNVVTKDVLIEKVWGWDSDAGDNNVEAYVSFLRKKLRFLSSSVIIRNYQKTGYKCEMRQSEDTAAQNATSGTESNKSESASDGAQSEALRKTTGKIKK